MLPKEAALRERISGQVRAVLDAAGFQPIETPTLEILEVLEQAGRISNTPFRLFDSDGELLCPRPDVTLQVARLVQANYGQADMPLKLRYNQRVFREQDRGRGDAREFTQLGVEQFGESAAQSDLALLNTLVAALDAAGLSGFRIVICTVKALQAVLDDCGQDEDFKQAVRAAIHANDFVRLQQVCADSTLDEAQRRRICALPRISGGTAALEQVEQLLGGVSASPAVKAALSAFRSLWERLPQDRFQIDFSVMSTFDYYTDLVFAAYQSGFPGVLGSGGRYDHMLDFPAAGFALYLENITDALAASSPDSIAEAAPALTPSSPGLSGGSISSRQPDYPNKSGNDEGAQGNEGIAQAEASR